MVEPVVAFTALHIGLEILKVVDRAPFRIEVILPIAPIAQRHVVVDANEIDIVICPKWIEMEETIPGSILRLITEVLRPIRSV